MPREESQLPLFDDRRLYLKELRTKAENFSGAVRAQATRRAYISDWNDFEGWCRKLGRKALPATEETVALYLCDQVDRYKVSTVERRLAAIRDMHAQQHAGELKGAMIRDVLRGARRELGSAPRQKAALRPEDLRAICVRLQRERGENAARDRALLVLGFVAAMRRSELAALDLADVQSNRKGLLITIRKSKTDRQSRGRQVGVFYGKRASTCPVRSLKAWLRERGRAAGPLFPGRGPGGRITGETVNDVLKRCVALIGLDPRAYGAHSLRAGFVTAAAESGAPETLIMRTTGHRRHETVAKYVRPATAFSVDVLAKAL